MTECPLLSCSGSANRRGRGEEGEDMDTAEEVDPEGGGGYLREGNVEGYLERMVPAVQGSQGDGEGQGTVDEGEAKLPTGTGLCCSIVVVVESARRW